VSDLFRLTRWFVAAFIGRRLRRGVLWIAAAEIGAIRTVAATATAAMPATTAVHSETVLATVALIKAVPGILLRLPAACDERGQSARILPAFRAAALTTTLTATLAGLLVGLLLLVMLLLVMLLLVMLLLVRPIVHLLIARRERLSVARQIWLLLRLRRVAWLVLSHERLRVIVVAVEAFVAALLLSAAPALLLRLLLIIVVGVLLPELFLSGGDQTEIMFGVLIVILGCHRVAGPLRVTRKLNVFFCNMGSRAADFHIGTVRFINTCERILAFAVVAAAPTHSLLTVSHVLPVRRPFKSPRCSTPVCSPYLQVHTSLIARPDPQQLSAPTIDSLRSYRDSRSNPIAAVLPQRCQPLVTRIAQCFEI
jgi:hypothetical protein